MEMIKHSTETEPREPINDGSTQPGGLARIARIIQTNHEESREMLSQYSDCISERSPIQLCGGLDQVTAACEKNKKEIIAAVPALVSKSVGEAIQPVLNNVQHQIRLINTLQQEHIAGFKDLVKMKQQVADTMIRTLWRQLYGKVRSLARVLAVFPTDDLRPTKHARYVMETIATK